MANGKDLSHWEWPEEADTAQDQRITDLESKLKAAETLVRNLEVNKLEANRERQVFENRWRGAEKRIIELQEENDRQQMITNAYQQIADGYEFMYKDISAKAKALLAELDERREEEV